jgi:hypothetical protein
MIRYVKARPRSSKRAVANYRNSIRDAIYGFWSGKIDRGAFVDSMSATISRGFKQAWHEGAKECGISPGDLTKTEINRMQKEVNKETSFIKKIADDIERNSKEEGGKYGPFRRRTELWANRYVDIRNLAKLLACKDKKLKWVWHPEKEHCADCARMNGRVYRASVWKKYNIRPRMRALACKGYNCGCEFVITDEPVTRGRPPAIGGK